MSWSRLPAVLGSWTDVDGATKQMVQPDVVVQTNTITQYVPQVVTEYQPIPPTLSLTGSIPTGAATGTVVGSISTNFGSATAQIVNAGGLAIQASGTNIVVGRPRDIMLQRFASVSAQALVASGALALGSPPLTIGPKTASFPITEALGSSATLTVTRAGGTGTLTCPEFNAPLTPLDVITAAGGTGPYRFSVITDGSPMEVAGLTSTTCQLYMNLWQDRNVATSQTCTVRAQDSTGAYGYLPVTVSITAVTFADVSGIILIDAANAVTSSSVVTGLNLTQGATNYLAKVPSGNTPPTLGVVTGPDGVSRPIMTHTATGQAQLAIAPSVSGSSTTLCPLFNQTAVRAPAVTIIGAVKPTTPASCNFISLFKASESGNHGVRLSMSATNEHSALFGTDSATYKGQALTPSAGTGWQLMTTYVDGYNLYIEPDNPEGFPFGHAVAPNTWNNGADPSPDPSPALKTNAFTIDSLNIGGGTSGGTFSWGAFVIAYRALTKHERQIIQALLARAYPAPFAPPVRLTTSSMKQTFGGTAALPGTFDNYLFGDVWGWEFDKNRFGAAAALLNPDSEAAWYINPRYAGITSTFPTEHAFVHPTAGPGGTSALRMRLQPLTVAQKAFIAQAGNDFGAVYGSQYLTQNTWLATGLRTWNTFLQYGGYFEVRVRRPKAVGSWECGWAIAPAGSMELDFGEGNNFGGIPGYSSCTYHSEDLGSQGGPSVAQIRAVYDPAWTNSVGTGVRYDDGTSNYHYWSARVRDNGDGTVTITFYCDREQVGYPVIDSQASCNRILDMLLDITMASDGNGHALATSNTVAEAPHFYDVASFNAWVDVDVDKPQPPLPLTKPTLAGARANGSTITATPGTWDWAATSDNKWYVRDWANGEVVIAGQTALTLTDSTANLTKTLIYEQGMTDPTWGVRIVSRQFMDPATTPNLSLLDTTLTSTTTLPSGVAAGGRLAFITPAPLGARVSITASDARGYFAVSADGRELLAGANYGSAGSSTSLYLTQTPRFGGPVNNQTIAVTVSGAGMWNATTGWTRSNANQSATLNATGGANIAASVTRATTGTYEYDFSVYVDTLPTGVVTIGIADSSFTTPSDLGATAHSMGVNANGDVVHDGFTTGGNVGRALAAGDTIHVKLKAAGGTASVYWNLNGASWVGTTSSANPTANTGGVSMASMTAGNVNPVAYAYSAATKLTGTF